MLFQDQLCHTKRENSVSGYGHKCNLNTKLLFHKSLFRNGLSASQKNFKTDQRHTWTDSNVCVLLHSESQVHSFGVMQEKYAHKIASLSH